MKKLIFILKELLKFTGALALLATVNHLPESATKQDSFLDRTVKQIAHSALGQWLFVFFVFGVVAVVMVVGYLMFSGPRMRAQPKILPYQAVMPLSPENSIPLTNPVPSLPELKAVEHVRNPVKATPENIKRGGVYYQYYCLYCHGDRGDRPGPVGESYVPVPANLRSEKIRTYSDGKLLRAMLAGVGHEPVLPRIVLPEHRWYLVLYLRQLSSTQPTREEEKKGKGVSK